MTARTSVLVALGGITTAAFSAMPGPYALLVAMSVAAGMMRGNLPLIQATAVTDRWGATHHGRLSGLPAADVDLHAAPVIAALQSGFLGEGLGGELSVPARTVATQLQLTLPVWQHDLQQHTDRTQSARLWGRATYSL
ncbi:hypothetical protein [Streptomyces mirabilis]